MRALFPLTVARSRLARRPGRVALVGLGVAAGAAALAGVLGGSLIAQDRSLARAIDRLPGDQRAVRAVWGGQPGQLGGRWAALDRAARPELRTLGLGEPLAATLFRESEFDGRLITLGGDRAPRPLGAGFAPGACRARASRPAARSLQIAGHGQIPNVPGLRLVVVGHGSLTSALPIENFISRDQVGSILAEAQRYHTAALPPFLLANGVREIAGVPALADTYRGYDWVVPLHGELAAPVDDRVVRARGHAACAPTSRPARSTTTCSRRSRRCRPPTPRAGSPGGACS